MRNKRLRRLLKSSKKPPKSSREKYRLLRLQQKTKRNQPVQPMRLTSDRERENRDPDPFNIVNEPENIYPLYKFEEWPLHPGIRYDQFRYGFCKEDILACMPQLKQTLDLDENDLIQYCQNAENNDEYTTLMEDYKLIQRALSHHNSNSREIRKQLVANEVQRWQKHSLDCGNEEIQS